eukprot:5724214-Amphidinium_carterae.1
MSVLRWIGFQGIFMSCWVLPDERAHLRSVQPTSRCKRCPLPEKRMLGAYCCSSSHSGAVFQFLRPCKPPL